MLQQNVSLKTYNTFGINATARYFFKYQNHHNIKTLLDKGLLQNNSPFLILGGGSNQLFTTDFPGIIIHPVNKQIDIVKENDSNIFVKVGAGKDWDEFVAFAVNNGWGNIENLSDIPGNVGASPVQNIGAYGVEAKDAIFEVHLVSLSDGSLKTLTNRECNFGYRNSIFKNELKNKYLVDSVTYKLTKKPVFSTNYTSLKNEMANESEITLSGIRNAIIRIRKSKLPCPTEIGSAGSFFKNPVIPKLQVNDLIKKFPKMVTYPADENFTKIAAGWLIDQCGLKGYSNEQNTAGIHDKQALVLINKGNATGNDIVELASFVQECVYNKFAICLEPEVIFI